MFSKIYTLSGTRRWNKQEIEENRGDPISELRITLSLYRREVEWSVPIGREDTSTSSRCVLAEQTKILSFEGGKAAVADLISHQNQTHSDAWQTAPPLRLTKTGSELHGVSSALLRTVLIDGELAGKLFYREKCKAMTCCVGKRLWIRTLSAAWHGSSHENTGSPSGEHAPFSWCFLPSKNAKKHQKMSLFEPKVRSFTCHVQEDVFTSSACVSRRFRSWYHN